MNSPLSSRFVAAAVLAAAALGAVSTAQAHPNVFFSIGLPLPPIPVPRVYVEPAPVYVQPEPVYVQPPAAYAPAPAYVYERSWGPSYRPEYERERAWRRAEWHRREWERREWERRHHGWDHFPSHGRD